MNEYTIRLNITLPRSLVAALDTVAGHRKRSRFIAQAVSEKIEQIKLAEMHASLREGYQIHQEESRAIVREFEGPSTPEN